jgi:hypothetical protein
MKQKALNLIPDLLDILMKQVRDDHDLAAARLIAEIAGLSKRTVGRPNTRRRDEPTDQEIVDRGKLADEVPNPYG